MLKENVVSREEQLTHRGTCFMHGGWVSQVGEFHINKVRRVAKGEMHTGRGHLGGGEGGGEMRSWPKEEDLE